MSAIDLCRCAHERFMHASTKHGQCFAAGCECRAFAADKGDR